MEAVSHVVVSCPYPSAPWNAPAHSPHIVPDPKLHACSMTISVSSLHAER